MVVVTPATDGVLGPGGGGRHRMTRSSGNGSGDGRRRRAGSGERGNIGALSEVDSEREYVTDPYSPNR